MWPLELVYVAPENWCKFGRSDEMDTLCFCFIVAFPYQVYILNGKCTTLSLADHRALKKHKNLQKILQRKSISSPVPSANIISL